MKMMGTSIQTLRSIYAHLRAIERRDAMANSNQTQPPGQQGDKKTENQQPQKGESDRNASGTEKQTEKKH